MRIALVATPLALPDMRPAPGSLDGDVIRARLPLADSGFRLVDLDPAVDLAEQIDGLFDRGEIPRGAAVLFYASCSVILSGDGELFLTLDPSSPETGDSVADLAAELCDRATGPVAFVLECRHAPDPEDPFRSAAVVAAAKEAVASARTGIELLVAAHPLAPGDTEDHTAPMTRALIEALDEEDAAAGLTLGEFFEVARESPQIVGAVPCFAHARGRAELDLLPVDEGARARREGAAATAEQPADGDVITADQADEAPAAEHRPAAASIPVEMDEAEPPPPRAPFRSAAASIPIDFEEPAEAPPPAVVEAPVAFAIAKADAPADKPAADLPRVMISEPAPKAAIVAAPPDPPPVVRPIAPATAADHMAAGDELRLTSDFEGALGAYKRALGMLSPSATAERAAVFLRQGQVKQAQDKRREAIAAFEKTISLAPIVEGAAVPPVHLAALEALLDLNVAEGDWRAVSAAEERVLGTLGDPEARFAHLVAFGARWQDRAGDATRARSALERARELKADDVECLGRLGVLYEQAGAAADALAVRLRLAELTRDPRARAEAFFDLGRTCLTDLRKEDLGLDLCDRALAADPTMLEPLALIARVLADRQEWSELEQAYRRMLDRVDHLPEGEARAAVTWELCRRLGIMFRDHLDDPALALDAFEDAVHAKPADLATRLTAAEIARSLGKNDRAAVHLEAAAALEPGRVATFHDLFESFQKLRRPDQAYHAACVTMFLRQADARERFIFEEHKPHGVPKPAYALRAESWEWLRPHDRDLSAEAILAAITPAAIALRLAQLAESGRLPSLDPAGKQDPEKSTVSIVRTFTWASHFLAVPAPAVYLSDERDLGLASVIAEEPTVFAGQKILRGRSLPELAFFVGRHLAYHVGSHRLLLYYSSIEDLTACFLAAVRIVLPEVAAPAAMRAQVLEIERGVAARLSESQRVDLAAAVAAFEAAGSRAHIAEWVAAVERCATRAGYLLAGDIHVVARILDGEPRGVLEPEAKLADLLAFAVSDEHRALREALGIAIQP